MARKSVAKVLWTMARKRVGTLLWIIIMVVLVILLAKLCNNSEPTAPPTNESAGMAFQMSKNFVEKKLKAPSTAKFCKYHEVAHLTESLGKNKWHIVGWVDAQNSFGAMIRNNYSCDMTYKGNNTWGCANLVIE